MGSVANLAPRIWPPEQLSDPFIRIQARFAVPGFDLSILANADADQPRRATDPEALTSPSALHNPRVRGAKVGTH